MGKERYETSWYGDRGFAVIEIPYAEDVDFFQKLMQNKGIHFDYRDLRENGNHVLIVFKDNLEDISE